MPRVGPGLDQDLWSSNVLPLAVSYRHLRPSGGFWSHLSSSRLGSRAPRRSVLSFFSIISPPSVKLPHTPFQGERYVTDPPTATADDILDSDEPAADMNHYGDSDATISIWTDEDDTSAMATEDDKFTSAGEDATSDMPEEVVRSSRPEGNPTPSRAAIVDLEDPDDPDEGLTFPSTDRPSMWFGQASRTRYHNDPTRKNKKARIALPMAVQFHLCQWMCSNHYLHGLPASKRCRTTLAPFKEHYNLHDSSKDETARRYFDGEIDECARRLSRQVKNEDGYVMVSSGAHTQRRDRVVEFKRGYDYLHRIDHTRWDGTLRRITLDGPWFRSIALLETWEIEDLRNRCTQVLQDRNPPAETFPLDPRLESSSETPQSTAPHLSKVSPFPVRVLRAGTVTPSRHHRICHP